MNDYWINRQDKAKKAIADKSIKDITKQLKKYYKTAMKRTISDFEETYNKLLEAVADGREPTPADLYKLDSYWQMQAQLKNELQKLGDKEVALLSKEFENEWKSIYNAISLPSDTAFSTISLDNAKTMINSSWLADGKTFSDRVWKNTEKLVDTLNEKLVECVVTGKKTTELKKELQERFNVSYNQANTLVRTEAAHIETQAAAQRYKDYGLTKYEFLGRDEHDIGCDCKKLNGKVFYYSEMKTGVNAPPLHPNCRCAIIPVIDDELLKEDKFDNGYKKCANCGTEFKPKNNSKICDTCREKILSKKDSIFLLSRGADKEDVIKFMTKEIEEISAGGLYERWLKQNPNNSLEKLGYKRRLEKNLWDEEKGEYVPGMVWYKPNLSWPLDTFNPEELFYACVDCGKVFLRNSNSQVRCEECNAIHRKKYKAQKEKERRAKKKLNK